MISPIHYIYIIGLCLRINDSGLFAWIRLTALSRTYFIECFTTTFLLTSLYLYSKLALGRIVIVWRKCRQNQPNLAKNVHHEVLIDFDTLDGML